ncbi:hypothetical protein [Lacinutrix salivirga]
MPMLLIDSTDYGFIILLGVLLVFGVPLIIGIFALALRKKKPKIAKILGIVIVVYALISLGYCNGLI